MKRELMWIPGFGWYAWKGDMIGINRSAGSAALVEMSRRAKAATEQGRQIIIYPEGPDARRAPRGLQIRDSPPLHDAGVPCLPVALRLRAVLAAPQLPAPAGHHRRRISRADPAGLPRDEFFETMKSRIETASDRLLAEGRATLAPADRQLDRSQAA
jgi:1-acyl-sn-glycerol-3-phosphate acyltransferase